MQRNKKTVTLQMVADYANVSMKTVSNVVNNWPYVTAETRQKVEEAIRIVGYRPNQAARSLVTGKTLIVGVVIPDISNPFFGMAMRGCEDTLYRGGYSLVLCNTNEDVEREKYNLDLLMGRGVDAMIVWGARSCCDELIRITGEAIPVVTVDLSGEPSVKNHININVDSVSGAHQATKCLIDQGYRRVAHMEGPTSRITAQRRAAGYYQALQESDLECDPRLVVSAAPSIRGGYRAGLEMLTGDRPEAIFCYNDLMAIGVMIAARELGISVPEALAIVGFDDISQASMTEPPLTTVRIDQYALGRLAGLIVLNQLQGKPAEKQSILFPVELKIRGSSGHQVFGLEARKAMLDNLISTLAADSRARYNHRQDVFFEETLMKYKPDWEQARERMVAYWNHAVIDRCCIAIHAPKDDSALVHPDIQNGPWLMELDGIPDNNTAIIEKWWTDPEWNYRRAITWFENTYFAGEALPVTYINWGASSMAAMFGSPAHFNKNSVWYPKVIEDWDTWRWEPNPEATPIWKAILAILDRLVEGAPGNYLVGKPELGNGADILSLIRGMDDLALDLINYPERVIDGVEMISSAWVRLMEEAHARVQPVNCGGDVLAWMGLWAPGKLDQLACDFSSVISPRMFRQFFVPEIVKMGGWCDYGVYHLDGPACIQHMLETLLTIPQIKAIQFTPGAGSPPTYTEAYLPRYRQILESGRNLYLLVQPGEVEKILASLPPEGLFMRTYVNTQEEADTMLKNVNKWSARKNKAVV